MSKSCSAVVLIVVAVAGVCPVRSWTHPTPETLAAPDAPSSSTDSEAQGRGPLVFHMTKVQLLDRSEWLVGDVNGLWNTPDGGKTWKEITHPIPFRTLRPRSWCFSFVRPDRGVVMLEDRVYSTLDGGSSWLEIGRTPFAVADCQFISDQKGWAVGNVTPRGFGRVEGVPAFTGAVFTTQDGGATWTQQRLPPRTGTKERRWTLRSLLFRDERVGWAVGGGEIFWTEDGGTRWNRGQHPGGDYAEVQFLDPQFGWATLHQDSDFAITEDGGRTWRAGIGPPPYGTWQAQLIFVSKTHAFSALRDFFTTEDRGTRWQPLGEKIGKIPGWYYFVGVAGDGTLVALGESSSQGDLVALVSHDNGVTWHNNRTLHTVAEDVQAETQSGTLQLPESELRKLAVERMEPSYPVMAKVARVSGTVRVEIVVDAEGRVASGKVLFGHPLLDRAALDAAHKWRFDMTGRSQGARLSGVLTFSFR